MSTFTVIIACRSMLIKNEESIEEGTIKIFMPHWDERGYGCGFSITSANMDYRSVAYGVDEMQAILVAYSGVKSKLCDMGDNAEFLQSPAYAEIPNMEYKDLDEAIRRKILIKKPKM